MTDNKFEQLVRDYPNLFQKAGPYFYMEINDGWYNIINTLLALISAPLDRARERLKYKMDNPDNKHSESLENLLKSVKEEEDNLPTLRQVKEKFGGLRFYMDGGTPRMQNYVEFAEFLSTDTCETCGAPGELRSGGWLKVRCDTHQAEFIKESKRS